jgi:hypothetical protein
LSGLLIGNINLTPYSLSELLLTLQGDGDYEGTNAQIPVDIVFSQGVAELGLE